MSEEHDYSEDRLDEAGDLMEPRYNVIEVNYRGVELCQAGDELHAEAGPGREYSDYVERDGLFP